jgi:hypothetical protein
MMMILYINSLRSYKSAKWIEKDDELFKTTAGRLQINKYNNTLNKDEIYNRDYFIPERIVRIDNV